VNNGYYGLLRAEDLALCGPIERQAGIVHQPIGGELWRLSSGQDRRDNVGSEEGEP
jgi:hypothetical protein